MQIVYKCNIILIREWWQEDICKYSVLFSTIFSIHWCLNTWIYKRQIEIVYGDDTQIFVCNPELSLDLHSVIYSAPYIQCFLQD
jgi:hypothetical protein